MHHLHLLLTFHFFRLPSPKKLSDKHDVLSYRKCSCPHFGGGATNDLRNYSLNIRTKANRTYDIRIQGLHTDGWRRSHSQEAACRRKKRRTKLHRTNKKIKKYTHALPLRFSRRTIISSSSVSWIFHVKESKITTFFDCPSKFKTIYHDMESFHQRCRSWMIHHHLFWCHLDWNYALEITTISGSQILCW